MELLLCLNAGAIAAVVAAALFRMAGFWFLATMAIGAAGGVLGWFAISYLGRENFPSGQSLVLACLFMGAAGGVAVLKLVSLVRSKLAR